LYRIAIRQVMLFWRGRERAARRCGVLTESAAQSVTDSRHVDSLSWVLAVEAHQMVQRAMSQLAAADREMLMLKHLENWSYREIAERLGVSYDKVVFRMERASRRMRVVMQKNGWSE
jgi:RNA polymerase sigma factor (sigma-70 family)